MDFKLEQIRKNKRLSRRELAEKSGVHEHTIVALEKGINDPYEAKITTLIKLADALKCRVKDFYCDKRI